MRAGQTTQMKSSEDFYSNKTRGNETTHLSESNDTLINTNAKSLSLLRRSQAILNTNLLE